MPKRGDSLLLRSIDVALAPGEVAGTADFVLFVNRHSPGVVNGFAVATAARLLPSSWHRQSLSRRKDALTQPLVKAAIAHLWFVTIHPFEDRNGRLGRPIAELCLARSDRSVQRFYSMSSQILEERKNYYEVLTRRSPDCESLCLADKFFSRISINEFSQPRKRLSPHDHGIAFPCPRQFQNFFGSPRSIHQITRVGFDRPAVGSALASDCIIAVQGPLFCFRVGRFPSQFICSDTLFFCTPDLNQLAWRRY